MKRTLLIRTDADATTGTGHAMRCIALAQGWADEGGAATFIGTLGVTADRVRTHGFEVWAGAPDVIDAARASGARTVVFDGYHFKSEDHAKARRAGLQVVVIDDCGGADLRNADVVVNQNVHADVSLYTLVGEDTDLLLGSRYVMLRSDVLSIRKRPAGPSILVTFGGSDPTRTTARILRSLIALGLRDARVLVAVGPHMADRNELTILAEEAPFEVVLSRDPERFSRLLEEATIAITAAGSTCWELAYAAVPFATVTVAPNQVPIARSLAAMGLTWDLGWYGDIAIDGVREVAGALNDRRVLAEKSGRLQTLVDGAGRKRVVQTIIAREDRVDG